MKKHLLLLLTLFFTYSYAQVDSGKNLQQLYDAEQYDEIIDYQPKKSDPLSVTDLYYKGKAHYMKSDDTQALKYFDLAIDKGPVFGSLFFYKGMIFLYANQFSDSLPYFDKAISLSPTEADFYAGKGEAFFALKNRDSAQVYFEKATQLPGCKPRPFVKLGEIYQERNENEQALTAFKSALNQLNPEDELYQNTSFNLGLTQQLTGNLEDAKATFEKHTFLFPTDYHAVAKRIQIYHSLSEFEKVPPLKKQLYAAHRAKKLNADMEKNFCFDQFIWKGKRILAFENFAEPDDVLFTKHHFFVMNDQNEIAYHIDSESSAAIRLADPKNKYALCLVKNKTHFTYWQFLFNDDYHYPDLKAAVLNILNDKVKPTASFVPAKK